MLILTPSTCGRQEVELTGHRTASPTSPLAVFRYNSTYNNKDDDSHIVDFSDKVKQAERLVMETFEGWN